MLQYIILYYYILLICCTVLLYYVLYYSSILIHTNSKYHNVTISYDSGARCLHIQYNYLLTLLQLIDAVLQELHSSFLVSIFISVLILDILLITYFLLYLFVCPCAAATPEFPLWGSIKVLNLHLLWESSCCLGGGSALKTKVREEKTLTWQDGCWYVICCDLWQVSGKYLRILTSLTHSVLTCLYKGVRVVVTAQVTWSDLRCFCVFM